MWKEEKKQVVFSISEKWEKNGDVPVLYPEEEEEDTSRPLFYISGFCRH